MPTTWNPNDKGPGITLANNNLTAVLPIPNQSVRSTTSKSTGKWYYEVWAAWKNTDTQMSGIMTGSGSDLSLVPPGGDAFGYGLFTFGTGWYLYFSGAPVKSGATVINDGDFIGICLDNNSGLLYYTLNGANLIGDPVAGTGGQSVGVTSWYAAVGGGGVSASFIRSIAANFGATTFANGPPSGFTAWDTSPFTYKSFGVSTASFTRILKPVGS
jgi:hypothetical protein